MQLIAVKEIISKAHVVYARTELFGVLLTGCRSDVQHGKRKRSDTPFDARCGCLCLGNSSNIIDNDTGERSLLQHDTFATLSGEAQTPIT